MKDQKYRNREHNPVPFHALDNNLVASLHAELRCVCDILQRFARIDRDQIERLITEAMDEYDQP